MTANGYLKSGSGGIETSCPGKVRNSKNETSPFPLLPKSHRYQVWTAIILENSRSLAQTKA